MITYLSVALKLLKAEIMFLQISILEQLVLSLLALVMLSSKCLEVSHK